MGLGLSVARVAVCASGLSACGGFHGWDAWIPLTGFAGAHSACFTARNSRTRSADRWNMQTCVTFSRSTFTKSLAVAIVELSEYLKLVSAAWCLRTPPTPSETLFPCPVAEKIHLAEGYGFRDNSLQLEAILEVRRRSVRYKNYFRKDWVMFINILFYGLYGQKSVSCVMCRVIVDNGKALRALLGQNHTR
uniref:Putative secreted protein n=1 Tax=Ixodes ricinus TaxID=34613 RepID=A0A6B0V1L2_IXORI